MTDILPQPPDEVIEEWKRRTSNMPEEMAKERFMELLDEYYEARVGKTRDYRRGEEIKTGGYFDTLSLGNWITVARDASVRYINAWYLGEADAVGLYCDCVGIETSHREQLDELYSNMKSIQDDQLLRWDRCGSAALKSKINFGECAIYGEARGYVRNGEEVDFVTDERLVMSFLNSTSDRIPVWARPILTPTSRPGWNLFGGTPGEWPLEFRVFVENGVVIGVSNYYPQATLTDEDEQYAKTAVVYTNKMLRWLVSTHAVPHHPRYEDKFDVSKISCTLDFLVDDEKKVYLIEGGPAFVTNPNWGGHPCCFDPTKPISGYAVAPGKAKEVDWLSH